MIKYVYKELAMARTAPGAVPFRPILVGTKCDAVVRCHTLHWMHSQQQTDWKPVGEAHRLARMWRVPHVITSAADDFSVQGTPLSGMQRSDVLQTWCARCWRCTWMAGR